MLRPKTLLIDSNVWIDYFVRSEKTGEMACAFMCAAMRNEVTLVYTPSTLKDVFYIIPRRLRAQAISEGDDVTGITFAPSAWACVRAMTEMAVAATTALPECELAWMLRHQHGDFEDNLIIAAAETCGADYVVTYDRALIEHFAPVCITPEQALNILQVA